MTNDDLIDGPRWRTRTTPERRRRMALVTFVLVLIPGLGLMIGAMRLLDWAGAPAWIVALPWLLPALGVLIWTLRWPSPAEPTDDGEQTWPGFAVRYVLVGETDPRPAQLRALASLALGGPVGWSVMVIGLLTIVGLA